VKAAIDTQKKESFFILFWMLLGIVAATQDEQRGGGEEGGGDLGEGKTFCKSLFVCKWASAAYDNLFAV